MNIGTISAAVHTFYETEICQGMGLKTLLRNVDERVDSDTQTYAQLSVLPASTEQVSIGHPGVNVFRTSGTVSIVILQRFGNGTAGLLALADQVARKFVAASLAGIVFRAPSIQDRGRDDAFWQVNVSVPFFSDTTG